MEIGMEDGTGVMGGGQVECEPALSPRAGDKGDGVLPASVRHHEKQYAAHAQEAQRNLYWLRFAIALHNSYRGQMHGCIVSLINSLHNDSHPLRMTDLF